MKTQKEITEDKRFQHIQKGEDGGSGFATIKGQIFSVVYSYGGGWDHVSVSLRNRCPTWAEMCAIKDMFFKADETCVEYHPAESDYVNMHPFCLHIWRCQDAEMPKPPKIYV